MKTFRPRIAAMMVERPLTPREELANVLSHGLGLLLVLGAAIPTLVVAALRRHDPWQLGGGLVFGFSLAALYATSTLYHLVPDGRAKRICRLLDHAAIYVLIAGSYTPFALGVLRGTLGTAVLIVVWTLAALGVALKLKVGFRFPRLSTALYLLMGWMVIVILVPLVARIGPGGFGWLLAGGLFYSLGVVFYLWEQLKFSHFWWHLFVLAGSACHCVAVVGLRRRAIKTRPAPVFPPPRAAGSPQLRSAGIALAHKSGR